MGTDDETIGGPGSQRLDGVRHSWLAPRHELEVSSFLAQARLLEGSQRVPIHEADLAGAEPCSCARQVRARSEGPVRPVSGFVSGDRDAREPPWTDAGCSPPAHPGRAVAGWRQGSRRRWSGHARDQIIAAIILVRILTDTRECAGWALMAIVTRTSLRRTRRRVPRGRLPGGARCGGESLTARS